MRRNYDSSIPEAADFIDDIATNPNAPTDLLVAAGSLDPKRMRAKHRPGKLKTPSEHPLMNPYAQSLITPARVNTRILH